MAGRALWEYTYRPCLQRQSRGGLYQGLSTSLTKMGHLPERGPAPCTPGTAGAVLVCGPVSMIIGPPPHFVDPRKSE